MTRDDIISMAREANIIDFRDENDDEHVKQMVDMLEHVVALVAAAEREACAITAWSAGMDAHIAARGLPCDARDVGSKAASAIRARGEPATREERRAHDERYLRATVEQTRTGRFA